MASCKTVRFAEAEDFLNEWHLKKHWGPSSDAGKDDKQEAQSKFDRFDLAVKTDDVSAVQKLLAQDSDLSSSCGPKGKLTILHLAAQYGALEVLHAYFNDSLLSHNSRLPNVNIDGATTDGDQTHPLYWAVREGHIKAVNILLDEGAAIKPLNSYQDSGTFVATMHMQPSVLQLLIGKGYTTDAELYSCLEWLIKSPHQKSNQKYLEVFKLLLDHTNLEVDNRGASCMMNAVSHGCPVEAVIMLQAGGVDFNMDILGEHLLTICIRYGRYDVLEFCLHTITNKKFMNRALPSAIRTGICGVKLLVNFGADLHMQTSLSFFAKGEESSLLNYALKWGCYDMVPYLLDHDIMPGDASLSILISSCTSRSDRFLVNNTWVSNRQCLSYLHHRVQDISSQLLSLRPQLIDEKWDNVRPAPIQEAIAGGLLCQVLHLIQYGANLEGMEEFALRMIKERERLHCSARKWNYYIIFYVILNASTLLQRQPYVDTKSSLVKLALVSLQERLAAPYRLQELCRTTIVHYMRGHALPAASELGLPVTLQKYIRYEDIIRELPLLCMCPKLDPTSDPCICQSVQAERHICI